MNNRLALLTVGLLLVTTLGILVVAQVAPLDPLAEFRTPDGRLTIPGGKFTSELQQLLFGPKPEPQTNYTVYRQVQSRYPTIEIRGFTYDLPKAAASNGVEPVGTDSFKVFFEALLKIPKSIISFFMMDARAACGDGASICTWDNEGADGLWSTASNWSNNTKPAAGDSVLFDATSDTAASVDEASAALTAFTVTTGYSSTITVNLAQTATWGTVSFTGTSTGTIDTNGFAVTFGSFTGLAGTTLTAGASTITVNGNWDSSVGTFTYGTSTIVFAAGATITLGAVGFPGANIYSLTVNASTTLTVSTNEIRSSAGATVTINGTITGTGRTLEVNVTGTPATPLVVGASGSISGLGTVLYAGCNNATYSVSLPSPATFPNLLILGGDATAGCGLAGFGVSQVPTFNATANITVNDNLTFYTTDGAAVGDFDLDLTATNYSLTVTGTTSIGQGASSDGVINLRASTVTFTGAVTINASGAFITTAAATVTASAAAYTNNSTNAADWNVTAGTWTFDSATGGTMTFAGTNLAEAEFNNVTFTSSAGTSQTFTMATRGLRLGGTLTVSDGVSTTALDTSVGDLAVTAGVVTIGAGGILTANGSTITVSGNWDSSAGTFTFGTSTVVIAAASTVTTPSAYYQARFYNLTINVSVTLTMGANFGVRNTLTINGSIVSGVGNSLGVSVGNTTNANPLVWGVSGDATGITAIWVLGGVNVNVPASANYPQLYLQANSGAVTYTFTGNVTATRLNCLDNGGATATVCALGANTLTVNGDFWVGYEGGDGNDGAFTITSGMLIITGNARVRDALGYMSLGSGSHTISGTWTNASTNASWDAGTGTVMFDSATGGTMTFAGVNLAEDEFNNVTFTSSAGTAQTFTMATRGLQLGGTLTVSDGVSTTTLTTSGSNLAITAGAVTIGAGGILTANASTITVNGNWDSSAGTFTYGTSTVVFAGSGTLQSNAGSESVNNFYNLTNTVGASFLISNSIGVANQVTVSGAGVLNSGAGPTLFLNSSNATPLVWSTTRIWISVYYNMSVPYTVATNGTYGGNLTIGGTATGTLGGTLLDDGANSAALGNLIVTSTATLAKSTFGITLSSATQGNLTMSGGDITSTSGAVSVRSVSISSVSSAIAFGSETWTVAGTWTNSTTSASWDAGTGSILFDSVTGGTMTFAGANLAEAEFNSVTFTSSAGTAQTFTMATRGLRWLTTLTVSDGTSTTALATTDLALGAVADAADIVVGNGGILTANASTVLINGFTMTGGTSGVLTITTGAWTVSGNWNSSGAGSTFTQGTGIHTFDATATITLLASDNTFDDLTISAGTSTMASAVVVTNALTVTGTLATADLALTTGPISISNAGVLTANASTVIATSVTMTGGISGTITVTTGAWTVSGNWDTSGAGSTYTQGTGIVTFDATASITLLSSDNTFDDLTIAPGGGNTVTLSSALIVTNALTITTGTFAKGTNAFTSLGSLTMDGGDLTSTSGAVVVTGNVNISSVLSAIDFGSEAWTVSGTWTNASTDGTVWEAGSGTVTFDSATGGTMTFAGANLAEAEFNSVTFTSSAGTPQTFTMATRSLRWTTTLSVTDAASTTTLATTDLGLSTGAISIGNGGILTANASTVSITSFTMTGGVSGTLTLTTGSWTLTGSWNSSGAGSVFTEGTSMVTMSGAATTITLLAADNTFNNLTISAAGTVTLASDMNVVGTLTVNSGAVFALATFVVVITTLAAVAGGITAGASGAKSVSSDTSISATGYFSFGGAPWAFSGTWTNDSTNVAWDAGSGTVTFNDATAGTMTFGGANLGENEFFNVTFESSAGTPQTFTMATRRIDVASTLTVNDVGSTTVLDTSGANLAINAVTVTVAAGGILMANGSTITVTSFDSTAGTYTVGTSTIVVSASGGTISIDETANNLTVNSGINTTIGVSLTWSGTLTFTSAGTIAFGASSLTSSGGVAVMTFASSTIMMSTGSWDTSSVTSGNFTATSSSVTFSGTGTVNISSGSTFASVIVSGGTRTQSSQLTATGLTISGGTLAKSTQTLTVNGNVTMSGGDLTSTSGSVVITGNVDINNAASAISFGSESWIVSGTWSNASTDAVGWSAGTATVTFDSATGGTMTFAGANLGEAEFASVSFSSTGGASQTFTMSTRGLQWATTLTITDGAGGTILAKDTQTLTGGAIVLAGAAGGAITSTSGAVSVTTVDIQTVASYIDLGSETWTVSGSGTAWSNATTSASWDAGSGSVDFTSAIGATVIFAGTNLSEDEFSTVTFQSSAGTPQIFTMSTRGLRAVNITISDGSSTTALDTTVGNLALTASATLTVGSGGILTANGSTITVQSIDTSAGTYTVGTSTVVVNTSGGTINIDETANSLTVNSGISTTFSASFTWSGTFTATSVGTLTFGASSLTSSGAAVMTFASSTITMSTGSWDTASVTSGNFTATSSSVTFSDTGSLTISSGSTFASVVVSGGTRTLASQFTSTSLTISGGTLAKNTRTVTVNGDLTMSGGDLTSTSGAGVVTGNVNISSASSSIDFGSETWTISGSWANASTDANWDAGTGSILFDSATGGTMTFAGSNLAEAEFNNVTFTSSAGTAQTFTMATRALRWTTTLSITDTVSTTALATADLGLSTGALSVGNGGSLTANATTATLASVTMTGGTSGIITVTTGAWTVSGSWNTSGAGSVYTQGTGIVTFVGSATITLLSTDNTFDDLTISADTVTLATNIVVTNTLTVNGTLFTADFALTIGLISISNGGILTANASTVIATSVTMTGGVSGTITVTTGAWTVSGNWNTSGAGSTYTQGTSTVTFSGMPAGVTITMLSTDNDFSVLTIVAASESVALLSAIDVTSALTVTSGSFNKQTFGFTAGSLTIDGGRIVSASGNVTISGNVNISSATSSINFGNETWTVSGTWTNSSTASAFWGAGTGTVVFDSATGGTMTFAGANLSVAEFNNVTFTSSAGTAQTFTMATRGIRWLTTLTISDGTSTTALATADLALGAAADAADIVVGNGGILTANASTVLVNGVTMTGGTNGVITVTTGAWTVSGSWNTSGVGSTYTQGTGIVTFNATATITLLFTDNTFDDLTISAGTVTLASAVVVTNALTISGGTFAKSTFAITSAGSLTMSGGDLTSTSGDVAIMGAVNISSASAIDFGSEAWTVSGTWTNASTDATWDAGSGTVTFDSATGGTMTFAGTNLAEREFNNVVFFSTGVGTVTFSMATRGLRMLDLYIRDTVGQTVLDKGTQSLTIEGGLNIGDFGPAALVSTSGDSSVASTVNIYDGSYVDFGSETWTISTNWINATTSSSWDAGTATVRFTGAVPTLRFAGALLSEAEFYNVDFVGGSTYTMQLRGLSWSNILTIDSGSILDKAVFTLGAEAAGALVIGPTGTNGLVSTSGSVSVTSVTISNALSYIDFGSEAWSVSGVWTNDSTSASWDAGSGTVTFTSATGGTMTFAGTNLGENEFNSVTFSSTGGTAQTFTMATRALFWGGTLTISDAAGTTELVTAGLGLGFTISQGALIINNGGILTASSSTIRTASVTMTGGISGTITLTSASWTVSGSWNTSGAGSVFTEGISTVAFDIGGTLTMLASDNDFNNLTIAGGTTGLANAVDILATLTVSAGAFAKQTFGFTAVTLNMTGGSMTSTSGDVTISGNVNISSASSAINFGSEAWTVSGTWTNNTTSVSWDAGTGSILFDSSVGGTMTFAGTNLAEDEFNNITFTSSAGTGQSFTMVTRGLRLGGTLTISDGSSTTTLDTSVADLAITAGIVSIGTGGILAANSSTLTFSGLFIDGTMTMDGFSVTGIDMDTSTGTIALTDWSAFIISGVSTNIEWTFNPSVAGDTVTITMAGLESGISYELQRDGEQIAFTSAVGGSVTFAVATGWSSHLMNIVHMATGGGGGPPPPPDEPPTEPPVVTPPGQLPTDLAALSAYAAISGLFLVLAAKYLPVLKESRHASRIRLWGIMVLIVGVFLFIAFSD